MFYIPYRLYSSRLYYARIFRSTITTSSSGQCKFDYSERQNGMPQSFDYLRMESSSRSDYKLKADFYFYFKFLDNKKVVSNKLMRLLETYLVFFMKFWCYRNKRFQKFNFLCHLTFCLRGYLDRFKMILDPDPQIGRYY